MQAERQFLRRLGRALRVARGELRNPAPAAWQIVDPAGDTGSGAMRFEGCVVVISGAAGRIGSALTEALLCQGAIVHALDIDADGLDHLVEQCNEQCDESAGAALSLRGETARLVPVVIDLADTEAISRFSATLDRVDVLINNVAIHPPIDDASLLTPAAWTETLQTNVVGPAHLTTTLVNQLSAKPGGAVVFITSVNAVVPSRWVHYAAAKAAVKKMVEDFARDFAPRGIRVNAVAPGRTLSQTELASEQDAIAHPLTHSAVPVEAVAHAVLFLADALRSPTTTGQHLVVDGGAHLTIATP